MGNKQAKFKKVFEEIDMNGDHKVSFFELAAFIISPKAVHELEEFTKVHRLYHFHSNLQKLSMALTNTRHLILIIQLQ